jgi:hypothetical protein
MPHQTFITLALIAFVTSCGGSASLRSKSAYSAAASDSQKLPWLNRTYDFGEDGTYAFVDGRHAELNENDECNLCLRIAQLTFGDVDPDGREEVLIVLISNLGGAGTSLDGYVFGTEDGTPVLRAKIEGGDRGDGGIESLSVDHGDLVVRHFSLSDSDGVCCPSQIETQRWHWVDGKLAESGPSRSEAWPSREWRGDRAR